MHKPTGMVDRLREAQAVLKDLSRDLVEEARQELGQGEAASFDYLARVAREGKAVERARRVIDALMGPQDAPAKRRRGYEKDGETLRGYTIPELPDCQPTPTATYIPPRDTLPVVKNPVSTYKLVLISVDETKKIQTIKALKKVLNIGLKEAKDAVDVAGIYGFFTLVLGTYDDCNQARANLVAANNGGVKHEYLAIWGN